MNCILFWNFRAFPINYIVVKKCQPASHVEGVCQGSHPTTASTQEIDCRSKEVYAYTSLLRQWFYVRGVKVVTLAKPPWESGRGARQRRRGGNGTRYKITRNTFRPISIWYCYNITEKLMKNLYNFCNKWHK